MSDRPSVPTSDPAVLAKWLAVMVAFAGAMAFASVLAGLTVDENRELVLALSALALPSAAALHLCRARLKPQWFPRYIVPAFILELMLGIYLVGEESNPAATFLILATVYCAYFFSHRAAAALVGVMGVAYAAALVGIAHSAAALDRWFFTLGVAVLTGCVVASLRDQLVARADADPLTGVLNSRAFGERLEHELQRTELSGAPLGLLCLDVDHFKALNDTRGHLAGDVALRAVAQAMTDAARGGGRVGRLGGDEFALLVPGADQPAAERCAAEIQRRVRSACGDLTVSVGAASTPRPGMTAQALISAADTALYAAKQRGRNRVVVAALTDRSLSTA